MNKQKMISRRTFLKGTGIVTVLVAGGGVWRASTQGVFSTGQGAAYEPWQTWQTDTLEGPLALVRAGILAANPHNTQPWLFEVTDTNINLYADTSRHLGSMDVYMREMHIGLGCAVENMLLAAKANGYEGQLTLSPGDLSELHANSEPVLAARLELSSGEEAVSELYKAIPNRHTDRGPYDPMRPVSPTALETLEAFADDDVEVKIFLFTTEGDRKQFAEGSVQATKDIITDATMSQDSAKGFRHKWQDVQTYKDGPYIDTAGVSPTMRALVKMLPPASEEVANNAWLDATETTLTTTPVMGFIAVRELYNRSQAMQAGQVWQRMHLWATTQGLSMQPVNQLLEVVDRERELNKEPRTSKFLADLIGDSSWQPTFAFRAGYPTMAVLASPRRAVEEVLI